MVRSRFSFRSTTSGWPFETLHLFCGTQIKWTNNNCALSPPTPYPTPLLYSTLVLYSPVNALESVWVTVASSWLAIVARSLSLFLLLGTHTRTQSLSLRLKLRDVLVVVVCCSCQLVSDVSSSCLVWRDYTRTFIIVDNECKLERDREYEYCCLRQRWRWLLFFVLLLLFFFLVVRCCCCLLYFFCYFGLVSVFSNFRFALLAKIHQKLCKEGKKRIIFYYFFV